jgi:hypothetical protein
MSLLDEVDKGPKLSQEDRNSLTDLITKDDIQDAASTAPKNKGLGLDGLPFELYPILIQHGFTANLLTEVMKNALMARFPESWKQTRSILLYKKGNARNLANWRSPSLINSDAKLSQT